MVTPGLLSRAAVTKQRSDRSGGTTGRYATEGIEYMTPVVRSNPTTLLEISVRFTQVLTAPASAIYPADFFDSDEDRNEILLIGVEDDGDVWVYEQPTGKWVAL